MWKKCCVLCFFLTAGNAAADVLLLAPNIQGFNSDEIIRALDLNGRYYFDIQDMSESLKFRFNSDTGRGTFLEKDFAIDPKARRLDVNGRDYYPLDFYENIFPIKLKVEPLESQLMVTSDQTLPTTRNHRNAARRESMAPAPRDDPFSNYEFDERYFSAPVVDLIYRRNESKPRGGAWSSGDYYQANLGMLFAGLDANATVFGDNFGAGRLEHPRARIIAGRTFLEEPGNRLNLVKFQAGDIFGNSDSMFHRSTSGRGAKASSFKDLVISGDKTIDINGLMPIGWEAELYLNNQLIGFRQGGIDGRYDFRNIPVNYGLNNFRVVMYGPFGEVREEERRYYSGTAPVKAGELGYSIGAYQARRYLIEANEPRHSEQGNVTADSIFYYGVSDHFVLIGGASNVESATEKGKDLQFGTVGAQIALNGVALQYNIAANFNSQKIGHHADAQGDIYIGDIFARYEYYGDTNSPISHYQGKYLSNLFEGRLTGWIPVANVPYFVSYLQSDFPLREVRARLSPNFMRYYNLTVENVWRNNAGHIENHVESLAQVSSGRFRIFARARYQTEPESYWRSYGAFSEYRWNRNTFINANWNHDCRSNYSAMRDLDSLSVGVGRLFRFGGIQISATGDTDKNISFGLLYNTSFGKIPDRYIPFMNSETQMANYGAIWAQALDENGDPVKNAKIIVSGRQEPSVTDENGSALIVNLESYQKTILTVDEQDVDEIALTPEFHQKKLVLRPGAVRQVDIPFYRLGGIEGQLGGIERGKRYKIYVIAAAGEIVAMKTADEDGAFLFDGIKYGDYRLEILNGDNNLLHVVNITIDRNFYSMEKVIEVGPVYSEE
ncbi:MAG: hypothetical protein FWD33_01600 [Alphaproteobacteria bacterium]|nr:hypothetical protein [Alphaproteobacteria bacterium]